MRAKAYPKVMANSSQKTVKLIDRPNAFVSLGESEAGEKLRHPVAIRIEASEESQAMQIIVIDKEGGQVFRAVRRGEDFTLSIPETGIVWEVFSRFMHYVNKFIPMPWDNLIPEPEETPEEIDPFAGMSL